MAGRPKIYFIGTEGQVRLFKAQIKPRPHISLTRNSYEVLAVYHYNGLWTAFDLRCSPRQKVFARIDKETVLDWAVMMAALTSGRKDT